MLEIAIGAAIGALIGALIPEVVKSCYRRWIGTRIKLSDEAKEVLRQMQSDPTNNGVFIETSPISLAGVRLLCAYGDIEEIATTWLVLSELESNDLVETVIKNRWRSDDEQTYVNLTHLGKVLNPDTGRAGRTG